MFYTMTAKFKGRCFNCNQSIHKGDSLVYITEPVAMSLCYACVIVTIDTSRAVGNT